MQKGKIKRSHLRLKKEKNLRLKFSVILMALIFLSIIYIWQRVTVLTLANEIKSLNVQIDNQQKEYKYLQVEVAFLSSVERIERLAKEMGFFYPSLEQIGVLPEAPDSDILERQGLIKNIWTKLKGISP
ncbi:MAG: cell division protein FtsL [candidate division Zixibacteria bacterium]|nr:cell division protein FtsL [candidate division Zixibacteria bacterium]